MGTGGPYGAFRVEISRKGHDSWALDTRKEPVTRKSDQAELGMMRRDEAV